LRSCGCQGYADGSGAYQCPFSKLPDLHFTLGSYNGYKFTLTPKMYSFGWEGRSNDEYVFVGLIQSPLEIWILGSMFLKHYYSVFDIHEKTIQLTSKNEALLPRPISVADQPSYFDQYYGMKLIDMRQLQSNEHIRYRCTVDRASHVVTFGVCEWDCCVHYRDKRATSLIYMGVCI